ncbi:MAG: ATPase [Nitrospirae bacterium]|nr:MAG: ATPase [Nitrospirota bacterium]
MKTNSLRVIKASGKEEPFDREKLLQSLIRSGASEETAQEAIKKIIPRLTPGMSTRRLYHLAFRALKKLNHASGLKYSLKKAIFKLGPTGYPFERYFSEILRAYGFKTETNLLKKGRCIQHEIDVLAWNQDSVYVVECKYHHSPGRVTNSKDALYVKSRFDDLQFTLNREHPDRKYLGWLVTNTRFSSDAIDFAQCAGYRLTSWRFPEGRGLEKIIEEKRLYPVTILSGIKANLSSILIERGVILLRDLSEMQTEEIKRLLNIPERAAREIKKSADTLCRC